MIATIPGVRVRGLAAALPERTEALPESAMRFGDDAARIVESTGVRERSVAGPLCTSDLCAAATEALLPALGWEKDSVDALIFVTQTPDYVLPATACSLHGRLGLAPGCAAFDVGLGCSGYVYGLWLASSLLAAGGAKRVLLLAGDTVNRIASPSDRATALLFGDAGTATALERAGDGENDGVNPWSFRLGTDGRGAPNLIVPAGGFRTPRTERTALRTEREGGNVRSDEDLFMDGAEVFAFTLRAVPALVRDVLADAGASLETVDAVVMHQANRMMLQHLARRAKVPEGKMVYALERYGNTSSASIPLALCADEGLAPRLRAGAMNLLLAGFGVGWSWGAAVLSTGVPLVIPQLVRVPAPAESPT